jgi:Flp pilus assembly protein TadD
LKCGRVDEAVSSLSEAARLKPAWAEAHCHLALALSIKHATGEAIEQYRDALSLNPDLPEALNDLAWILATQPDVKFRDGAEAVRLAEHACELTSYHQVVLVGTLAAAYAESDQFEKAAATAGKACALASALGQTNLLERNQAFLRQYENRQPCRERN